MAAQVGQKVLVRGNEQDGFAEVISYPDSRGTLEVAYYTSPVRMVTRRVLARSLVRTELPSQTRCYYKDGAGFRIGRVVTSTPTPNGDSYHVCFPNDTVLLLPETEFHVRSYLKGADPVATLSSLANETPFLFERRSEWLERYVRQVWLSRGLRGLISSKIELFPHQVEIARRVLQDPVIRYLLADEVGLGKTIEAGIILHQLHLDTPSLRIVVLAPNLLVHQWRDELARRFGLENVEVRPYEQIGLFQDDPLGSWSSTRPTVSLLEISTKSRAT
jgi:ATP-dependent helicase HepA